MTTQINIRLDEHLLEEIDALTRMLHVPRSEWLRMKLAEAVKERERKHFITFYLVFLCDISIDRI